MSDERFGYTIPHDLGKDINGIISPHIFNNRNGETEDIFKGDFTCNVSDIRELKKLYPSLNISNELYHKIFKNFLLCFMCKPKTLTLQRMVEYINSTCSDVLPYELSEKDFIFLGTANVIRKGRREVYIIPMETFSGDRYNINVKKVERVVKPIQEKNKKLSLRVAYGKKEDLNSYFRKNPDLANELKTNGPFLLIIGASGKLTSDNMIKLVKFINGKVKILNTAQPTNDSIIKLGTLNIKQKTTGQNILLDFFAIDCGENKQ
jgi:hypothetical protein